MTFSNSDIRALDIDKTVWISPGKLVYSSLREFDIHNYKGAVIGGDWDRTQRRFEDLDVYVAFKEVMEGKSWIETIFYQRILGALNNGEVMWSCRTEADLQQRCKHLEAVFQTVKYEGYKTQHELQQSEKLANPLSLDDEVTISIGRDGDLLFSNGAHRLSIAKLLGIEQIPVKIAVRHPKWMALVGELLQYAKMQGGKLYQPATHPDLRNISAFHDCENRFLMIRENMSARGGRLLDIGANLGYFCHRFEDEGFECYAVEENKKETYFLQKLRRAENRKFEIVPQSIFEWSQVSKMYFDVVLALNVFHHALKTKDSYHKLVTLLQNLQMRELFFEPPNEDDPQMQGAYRNYSPSEFVEFMMRVTRFKTAEPIGEAGDGRKIYRLS